MSIEKIDSHIRSLAERSIKKDDDKFDSLEEAIELANEIVRYLLPADSRGAGWAENLQSGKEALRRFISTKKIRAAEGGGNIQNWFCPNPAFGGELTALYHFDAEDAPFESKFYWLKDNATKARISAGVMLTPNWEDAKINQRPEYKVGVDFFLPADLRRVAPER